MKFTILLANILLLIYSTFIQGAGASEIRLITHNGFSLPNNLIQQFEKKMMSL